MTKTQKVLKGAGIAGSAAALTYLLPELANLDFGQYTPFVVAGLSVLINVLLKAIQSYQEAQETTIEEI